MTAGEGITIVGASAGSGKTYRLTREVTNAIDKDASDRVHLEGLVAVTFTRKAHTELAQRIRQKLVQQHAFDDAMRLPLAYLGTVHAACLRLLQEFAVDAGLSPNVEVLSEDAANALRQAFESALDKTLRDRLDELANVVELRMDPKTHRVDWLTPVFDIMELARSNRIAPDSLREMAHRSYVGLLELLPKPLPDERRLDRELATEMDRALVELSTANDGTKKTADVIKLIETARRLHADSELPWSFWPKLAQLNPGKTNLSCVAGLCKTAEKYEAHPRLHAELQELTAAIFEAACVGLSAYQEWKGRRRVVDYVDMLDRALDLVDHPRVRKELERRLQLVVVDEFQDTSPIQLALFVRLHSITKRSVWVGDRKQCIFEYAGADPLLMDSVADWVSKSGGTHDRLGGNYRSRTELVDICSEIFVAALAKHGFTRDEVVVTPQRDSKLSAEAKRTLATLPPFGLWCLEGRNAQGDAESIAEGVRRTLEAPERTPIIDRSTRQARPVRPGDIAILVATNAMAAEVAASLHARGIRAALARAGLLGTPEGRLADAALRWLHDDSDSLAAATIDALTGYEGRSPDEWLELRIQKAQSNSYETGPLTGWRAELAAWRPRLDFLSPAEALDGVLEALDAVLICARWPDPPQRLANIDSLRALASKYEERCHQQREAATVAGLLRYFDDVREERLHRDEVIASDDQHVPTDDGAVVVCTYHKSKGLEWPVVVLATLDRSARRHAFEVTPETDRTSFDPEHPLSRRWIRYWVWPFGQKDSVPLAERAARSREGVDVAEREEKERARLLYVGFTRARDHVIFAARVAKDMLRTAWLDSLTNTEALPVIELPREAPDDSMAETRVRAADGTERRFPTRVLRLPPHLEECERAPLEPRWFVRRPPAIANRVPFRIKPSGSVVDWEELAVAARSGGVAKIERLPFAIPVATSEYAYDILGNTVHAFLAADVDGLSPHERLERATRLLTGAEMDHLIEPRALLQAGDQLRSWVLGRWPAAVWHREISIEGPIDTPQGKRRITGIIDLLLETKAGYIIIDHKTFPGTAETAVHEKALSFLPQMLAYASLLRQRPSSSVAGIFLHLPISGVTAEFTHPSITTNPQKT